MIGFLFSFPGKIITGLVLLGVVYGAGQYQGRSAAMAKAGARAAKATIEQLKERGLINESVSGLSDCDLLHELDPDGLCDNGDQ